MTPCALPEGGLALPATTSCALSGFLVFVAETTHLFAPFYFWLLRSQGYDSTWTVFKFLYQDVPRSPTNKHPPSVKPLNCWRQVG